MTLEAKGTIKRENNGVGADGKPSISFSAKAPTLGIDVELPKWVTSTENAIQFFQELIKEQVQKDFQRPIEIALAGETVSCTYFIDPINNRTLDEFQKQPAGVN
jgi:hypothetical protein